jgi:transposase
MSSTLAKKLADVKPGTLFIGVDLGRDCNTAVAITGRAQRLTRFSFSHDRNGYDFFHRRLTALREKHQPAAVLVGMEPTNYFWKLLATDLEMRHVPYRLVNSYTVKKHREGDQLDRSKDDVRDAFVIADLVRTGKFTETQLLQGAYAELRRCASLGQRLRRDLVRQNNLLHASVGQLFPELPTVFKNLTGATALAMLRHHAAASTVAKLSEEAFIAGVRADLQGQRLLVSKLRQAHALATTSVGLHDGLQALQLRLRQQIDTLTMLQAQSAEAREVLTGTFLALPESRFFLSVNGLGLVTAATILGELGDPSRYRNAQQWVKLAGTQPAPNTSGRKSRSRTPMSKKGRPLLRTCLFFAVMRLIQVDDAFARDYLRFQQRDKNALTKMQALGALMNKLLRILWALVRHQTFYNPAHHHAS